MSEGCIEKGKSIRARCGACGSTCEFKSTGMAFGPLFWPVEHADAVGERCAAWDQPLIKNTVVELKPMECPRLALMDMSALVMSADQPDEAFLKRVAAAVIDTEYKGLTDEELARAGITRGSKK